MSFFCRYVSGAQIEPVELLKIRAEFHSSSFCTSFWTLQWDMGYEKVESWADLVATCCGS